MGELSNLANRIDNLAASIPAKTNEAKQEAASVILLDLSQVTPVDVGDAVSNWQASLDAPVESPIPAFAASPKGRMRNRVWTHTVPPEVTREANAPLVQAAGEAIIRSSQPGQPIFLTNTLNYIEELNQGSSQQAPAGFVDRAKLLGKYVVEKLTFVL